MTEIFSVLASLMEGESVLFETEEDIRTARNSLYWVYSRTGLKFVRKRFLAGLRVWQHGHDKIVKREPLSDTRFQIDIGFPLPTASERKSRSYGKPKPTPRKVSENNIGTQVYGQIKSMAIGDTRYFGYGDVTNARVYASRIGKVHNRKYRTEKMPDGFLLVHRWG